jgi:DNA-binding CsgD family transcriptional regulator
VRGQRQGLGLNAVGKGVRVAALLHKSVISPTFIGREEQLATLRRLLEAVAGGSGGVVLLSGEAGLGKTRFTAEIKYHATQQGFVTLQCQCQEPDRSLPYAPVVDLLRHYLAHPPANTSLLDLAKTAPELSLILPELTVRLGPEPDKYGLFYAVERWLFGLADQVSLLLVVEDLHWSDDASLDLLLHLAQRLASRRLLLLLTYRSEEAEGVLGRFLLALNRTRLADEVILAPFTPEEVDAQLRAIFEQQRPVSAEFLNAVCQLTEGNPFFIEEILKSLLTAGDIFLREGVWDRKPLQQLRIPRSVQLAVEQRLSHLEPDARRLTFQAAVVGRRFNFDLLRELMAMDDPVLLSHLKQLVAAQIIVEDSAEAYAFRHALTREAVYGTLLRRERQQHHRRIAQIMEELHSGQLEHHAADLAYHYYHAADWEKVWVYAQQAGDRARTMYAPREAADLYSQALEAAEHLGQPPSPELCRSRGQAYETLGQIERARADYEQALRLAQQSGDLRAEWQGLIDFGFLWAAQDYARAGDYFRRALALAQTQDDPILLAHSLNRLGNWHTNIEQHQAAREYHQAALDHFERLDDRQGRAETLDLLGLALSMAGDYSAGLPYSRRAIQLFEELDDRRGLASCLAVVGCAGGSYLSDLVAVAPITLNEATVYAEQSLEISRLIGSRSSEVYALVVLSINAGSLGGATQALEQAHRAIAIAAEIDHRQWLAFAQIGAGLAYESILALPAARQHQEQALALAREVNSPFWLGLASGFLAMVYIQQNELESARALLPAGAGSDVPIRTFAEKLIAAAGLALSLAEGSAAAAEPLAGRLLASAGLPERMAEHTWQAAPGLMLLHGEILAAQKRFPEAVAALETALLAAEAQGARPIQWRLQAALGRCWRARRKFEAADLAFAAARGLIETLADEILDPALRSGFREAALAQLPRPRPGAGRRAIKREFGGLTPRERDIAILVGQGRSNRAIATALVLSERTVQKHVSNILGKLSLETRGEIAAWVHANALAGATPS